MKTLLTIVGLSLTFLIGGFVGSAAGFDPIASGTLLAGASVVKMVFFSGEHMQGLLLTAIDITELASKLGAYHREHRNEIASKLLLDEDFTSDLEVYDDVTDELPLTNITLGDLTRPGLDGTFQPAANKIIFGARILKVRDVKVDLLLNPKILEKTWLGKMKKANDPWDMPFEAYIMDYINSKITEELRLQSVYRGVYNAAGSTPIDNFNGFLKIVADEITATNITPIATGAITSANVVDKLEQVYDGLGEAQKGKPTIMKVNSTIFDWYNRKYRADFGGNMDYKGMGTQKIMRRPLDGTNCELVREPGLGTSQRVMASLKENFAYGVDSKNGYSMDIQKFDRTLKVLIDLKAGVELELIDGDTLAVNDQA